MFYQMLNILSSQLNHGLVLKFTVLVIFYYSLHSWKKKKHIRHIVVVPIVGESLGTPGLGRNAVVIYLLRF